MNVQRAGLFALVACGAVSLLFDLTLSFRLPSEADWAELAGALRAQGRAGDAVQIWPAWAEEARLYVDAMPVILEEDLAVADYLGVQRLWVASLPRAPYASSPDAALERRGATAVGPPQRFGALALRPWDLHAAKVFPLTPSTEEHEIDYVARRCFPVRIGSRFSARGPAGTALHVRAGIIGERAYDERRPDVVVRAFAGEALLGTLDVPRTARDGEGFRKLDVPLPAGPAEREFSFAVESRDPSPPFCLEAWTSG